MKIQYNKLWKILIDKNMNKVQLRETAGISSNSLAKLGKNESVRMDVLMKIATALDCKVEDLFETFPT
ncbi:helix-turn-helix domain-containing protein [Trueperella sp. LYQ143]|uniref:helix-turn-helix domain-containing protein n=1 Tax=Trueperella sp. LYQ143 TaxID=3391059 RepID=UPI003983CFD9